MAIRIQTWDKKQAEKELKKRRKRAEDRRSRLEPGWLENEELLFTRFGEAQGSEAAYSTALGNIRALREERTDGSYMDINYAFRHLRFIHAQMSNNPPSVIPKPTSSEHKDRQAAIAADKFVQHARRKFKMQERIDLTSLMALVSGTGYHRIFWDTTKGEALDADEQSKEVTMTGDITSEPVSYWDIYLDPDAQTWDEVGWLFHRHRMPFEEAMARWPEKEEKLRELRGKKKGDGRIQPFNAVEDEESDTVEVWEYWERGLPWNGLLGRHAFQLEDGCLLADVEENPFPKAQLPYDCLTDIDVPGQVYGKTFVDYIAHIQDILNRLDSQVLDGVKAHAVVRMVVVNGQANEEGITNENWEIVPVSTAGEVHFVNPPSLMPDLYKLRESIIIGMEALAGVNESMYGQVKREMSGYSLQTAIDAGNMVRSRLFNKYKMFVENIYSKYLLLVQEHYADKRKVIVAGEEDALSVAYLSGADLEGGFDVTVEFGTSFSLSPAGRREEIMQLAPFLEKAGVSPKTMLNMMRLNEIDTVIDLATLGQKRQTEIFEEMISTYMTTGLETYIAPEKNEDHASMMEQCKLFRMSAKWKTLPPPLRALLDRHIDDRMALMAQQAAPAMPPGMVPGGAPVPAGAAPAMPAGGAPMGAPLPPA